MVTMRNMATQSSFQRWYAANGADFNAARREKYHKDAEHRKAVLAAHRRQRKARVEARKAEQQAWKEQGCILDESWTTETVVEDGVQVPAYAISAVATLLGCSPRSIHGWEARGVLPVVPYRKDGDVRLFTKKQVDKLRDFVARRPMLTYAPATSKEARLRLRDGSVVSAEVFRIAELCRRVGICVDTFRGLERRGVVPPAVLRTHGGQRMYTSAMAVALRAGYHEAAEVCEKEGRIPRERKDAILRKHTREVWAYYDGATPVEEEPPTNKQDPASIFEDLLSGE